MARADVKAAAYREVVTIQTWTGSAFATTGTLRASVLQKAMGPLGSQSNCDFTTRYRTDLSRANLLVWRGTEFFISNLLDQRMQKREITITGINAVPISFTSAGSGSFAAKSVSSAVKNATTLDFGTLATGLTAVAPGDTFKVTPYSAAFTITNSVAASAGALTGVTFTPGLPGSVAAAAAVNVTRTAKTCALQGSVDSYQGTELNGTLVQATDVKVFMLAGMLQAAGYTGAPIVGDQITVAGRNRTVQSVLSVFNDGVMIAYELQAR